ncbi:hypothetical protein Snas_3559 [Stackebrandtia nassauensis DSM 44728]|uniref:Uncharacterized protein n=2 Tax=Stackebrandtia TaxID=283810 RepID=D3PWJ9_STANL|nr:hypothetical protein Snas_3559 [Stackebrandtia nassauensis DSM 44728]
MRHLSDEKLKGIIGDFWSDFHELLKQYYANFPEARETQAEIAKHLEMNEKTLSDWLRFPKPAKKMFSLPKWDKKHKDFENVVEYFGSNAKHWFGKWKQADAAKHELKHRADHASVVKPPRVPDDHDQPATVPRKPRWIRPHKLLTGAIALVAIPLLVWGGLALLHELNRECATVTAVDGAPVYRDIDQPPFRTKKFGDRIEFYQGAAPASNGMYVAVVVKDGSQAWMSDDDLSGRFACP